MGAVGAWLGAFLFTQAIEVPLYVGALRRGADPVPLRRAVAVAFGASAVTHPVVWFVMPPLADAIFRAMLAAGFGRLVASDGFRLVAFGALAEGFAVAVEASYLRAFRAPRPLLLAFAANLASASAGYISFRLTGWP